jgi:hypothetical protein
MKINNIIDIKNNGFLLFECISGSKAYGLDTPESDTDIRGVFYLPKEQFYGLNYVGQINGSKNDEVYYEIGRFVELLLKNNPNMLELLMVPEDCVLYSNEQIMGCLKPEMFLSKLCKDTFAGYAMSQIRKARGLNKKILNPMDEEKKSVEDFCYVITENGVSKPFREFAKYNRNKPEMFGLANIPHMKDLYNLYFSNESIYHGVANENAHDVHLSSIPKGEKPAAQLYFNKEAYSSYCREYKEYKEWVENRNEFRYRGTLSHGKRYDAKNMSHTIRLLQMSVEILKNGEINVRRKNRDELLSIKRGEWEYNQIIEYADSLIATIETEYKYSTLPDKPDVDAVENSLVKIREMLYENN